MISKLKGYAAVFFLLASLGLGAWGYAQSLRIEDLSDELDDAQDALEVCEAQQADILDHKERKDEIYSLGTTDLIEHAAEWMRDF